MPMEPDRVLHGWLGKKVRVYTVDGESNLGVLEGIGTEFLMILRDKRPMLVTRSAVAAISLQAQKEETTER
jgi:hypothetical protein